VVEVDEWLDWCKASKRWSPERFNWSDRFTRIRFGHSVGLFDEGFKLRLVLFHSLRKIEAGVGSWVKDKIDGDLHTFV
jgi:hypothetical protein